MKVSDAIAKWLAERGCRHVFTVSGGANLHILDSIAKRREVHDDIRFVCMQNEQACGFAADAQARLGAAYGVYCVTSGPGATNAFTPLVAAWCDSVPLMLITGNQTRARLEDYGTRGYGFQALPIAPAYARFTKYAVTVMDESKVTEELWKAHIKAREGRPGPVLIDIPDDVARGEI